MVGRQASSAAMLAAAAVGFVVAGFPAHAGAQSLAQPAAAAQLDTVANQQANAPPSIAAQQSAVAQSSVQQQGVAVPQRPANQARRVNIQLGVNAIYDTNATRSNALRATSSRLSRHDIQLPLSVNLDIFLPSGPNTFSLSGNVGYIYNVRNTARNRESIGLHAGYARNFQPCAVALGGLFQRGSTQLGNSGFLNGQVGVATSNVETRKGIDGSVSCGSLGGLRPFVSGAYSDARNTDAIRQFSDYNTITYGAGLVFGQASFAEIGVLASIDDTKYPNRVGRTTLLATSFQSKSIGVYFQRAAARHLQARVQVNYTAVNNGGSGRSFKGLSGQGNATFIPGGRFIFDASFARATSGSLSTASDYQIATTWGASVAAALGGRTRLVLGYHNAHREYVASVYDPVHPLINDTLRSLSLSTSRQIGRRLSFDADITRESRSANDPFFNYKGMRFSIGASLGL